MYNENSMYKYFGDDFHQNVTDGTTQHGSDPSYILKLPEGTSFVAGAITLTIMLIGVIGNLLTIVALLRCPRVRNVAAAFIISLCVADFFFCLLVLPIGAMTFIYGSWRLPEVLCTIMPLVRYGNVGFSLLSIAMITINRYIMIGHHSVYARIYRPVNIAAMLVFCWLLSFGMQIPTALKLWGQYAYDPKLGTCSIMEVNGRSSKRALFVIGFICPCLVIICCYTRIFWIVRSSEARMRKHANRKQLPKDSTTRIKEKREAKAKRNEWRITKMVLAIFLSFILCYLPITIVKVILGDSIPVLTAISYILLYLSACINPVIYVIMNKQYRQAYKTVLMCERPTLLSVIPGPGSSYGGDINVIRSKDRLNE